MDNQLFRRKSLDHISSPEELHDYIRVPGPRVWMLLAAVLVLLAGFIAYAGTAVMENTLPVRVRVETAETAGVDRDGNGAPRHTEIFFYLPASQKDAVKAGMAVRIGTDTGKVSQTGTSDDGRTVCTVEPDRGITPPPDGEYDAELILERTTPISFLWE